MESTIKSTKYISCGSLPFPQIVVKANQNDVLSIAAAWHKMIDTYPLYSSAIGLTSAASKENISTLIESVGSDIEIYTHPLAIGCFACETDDGTVFIDPSCAHPLSFAAQVFVLEKLLEINPEAHVEIVLVAIPESFYPEQLVAVAEQILEILSADGNEECLTLSDYAQILEAADKANLTWSIEKKFKVHILEREISSKTNIRDLADAIYVKKILNRK